MKPNTHAWEGVLPEHQSSEFPLPEGKVYPSSEARFLNLRMTPGIAESMHNGAVASLKEINAALEEDRKLNEGHELERAKSRASKSKGAQALNKSSGTTVDAEAVPTQAVESVPEHVSELEPIASTSSGTAECFCSALCPWCYDIYAQDCTLHCQF